MTDQGLCEKMRVTDRGLTVSPSRASFSSPPRCLHESKDIPGGYREPWAVAYNGCSSHNLLRITRHNSLFHVALVAGTELCVLAF